MSSVAVADLVPLCNITSAASPEITVVQGHQRETRPQQLGNREAQLYPGELKVLLPVKHFKLYLARKGCSSS